MKYLLMVGFSALIASTTNAQTHLTHEQRDRIIEKLLATASENEKEALLLMVNSRSEQENLDGLIKRFGYQNEMYYDAMVNSHHLDAVWQILGCVGAASTLYLILCFLRDNHGEKLREKAGYRKGKYKKEKDATEQIDKKHFLFAEQFTRAMNRVEGVTE